MLFKGNVIVDCGFGDCSLTCADDDSCTDLTVYADDATSFSCAPTSNCNSANSIPSPFTMTTNNPTPSPTLFPTPSPTDDPSKISTLFPSNHPSNTPTKHPSQNPVIAPMNTPTIFPTIAPTMYPTNYPTSNPSVHPTTNPITLIPTAFPSASPLKSPTINPSKSPTQRPSVHHASGSVKETTALPTTQQDDTLVHSDNTDPMMIYKVLFIVCGLIIACLLGCIAYCLIERRKVKRYAQRRYNEHKGIPLLGHHHVLSDICDGAVVTGNLPPPLPRIPTTGSQGQGPQAMDRYAVNMSDENGGIETTHVNAMNALALQSNIQFIQ